MKKHGDETVISLKLAAPAGKSDEIGGLPEKAEAGQFIVMQ